MGNQAQTFMLRGLGALPLVRTNPCRPTLLLVMGLPAAGKTTVLSRLVAPGDRWTCVDSDELKPLIEGYDERFPERVHRRSSELALALLDQQLACRADTAWVTTGANVLVPPKIEAFRASGFLVVVVAVAVSLDTAQQRNLGRRRRVPPHIIDEAAQLVPAAAPRIRLLADLCYEVDNNERWRAPA